MKPSQSQQLRFQQLLAPHTGPLFRLAWRFCGSRHDAEDLLQDLLIKLYPRLPELEQVEQLRPWLSRVLYRLFIDMHRSQSRSPLHLVTDHHGDEEDAPDPILEQPADSGDEPEHALGQTQLQREIQAGLDRLSDNHRTVLMLHDVEGYALNEMEIILDCPIGTLKSRLHRARARLRELLIEQGTVSEQQACQGTGGQ
ncbi:MAG: RNA polymerase sigma factor [Gammaproteobacteria bacterium]|nr:RNA polymerase sigma factor [Gammaproteobacteria bacterium]